MSRRKCSFQKKKITTVNSFFHYDDIRLLYERIQYLQLHNTFFSINHCWVVNNMDAGKISICNNWIRKWSGAEETIFDLAIFLCIRRRYSLLLSHACIIHIRLLNNGEWSDYTTNISVGTHSFKSLKNMQNSLRTFIWHWQPCHHHKKEFCQGGIYFLLQLIIFVNSIITNENFVSIHIILDDMIVVELQKYSSQLPCKLT